MHFPDPPAALQAARADAQAHFRALLQELHLGPDARWRDYSERVKRDPQVNACACVSVLWQRLKGGIGCLWRLRCLLEGWAGWLLRPPESCAPTPCPSPCLLLQGRGTNPALERGEAEDAFRSHVQEVYEAALEAFLDLLDAEIKVGGQAGRQAGRQAGPCAVVGGGGPWRCVWVVFKDRKMSE